MSNLEDHEREQRIKTAAWEAWHKRDEIMQDIIDNDEGSNRYRAARVFMAIMPTYDDTPENAITDALSDLRHLSDMFNLEFAKMERAAHDHYSAEVVDGGVANLAGSTPKT